jgi:hypothetical protein
MALVTLSLPDSVLLKYGSYNPDRPEDALVDQLKRFQDIPTGKRAVVLSGDDLAALEKLKVGFSIENAGHILAWVKSLIEFNIAGSKFALNEGQMKRLKQFAAFWKKPYKDALEQTIQNGLRKELGG